MTLTYEVFINVLFDKSLRHSSGTISSRKELSKIVRFLAGMVACAEFKITKVKHDSTPMDVLIDNILVFTYCTETLEYQMWYFDITRRIDPLALFALKRRFERSQTEV